MDDLTTEEGVVALMESSLDSSEWNENLDKVKRANGGQYPAFWYKAIILARVAERAGLSSELKISPIK